MAQDAATDTTDATDTAAPATVSPYLIVPRVPALITFLVEAFGGEEGVRALGNDGNIRHAEVRLGNTIVMLSEADGDEPPMPATLYLRVGDVDATYAQALNAGATSLRGPEDQPYGERNAGVQDGSGNRWWISAPL